LGYAARSSIFQNVLRKRYLGLEKHNKLIDEVEHAKRCACPVGIPNGFLSEELHPGESGFAFHRAGRADPSGISKGFLCKWISDIVDTNQRVEILR
jgi:hypothetical protein